MKEFLNKVSFEDFVKDSKINASNILANRDNLIPNDLVAATVLGVLYAKNSDLVDDFIEAAKEYLDDDLISGAKAAANIMNMNNVYYRGKEILGKDFEHVNPGLRMNIYTNHGIKKEYFEFISLAVSFINNCEFCIQSHSNLLIKNGMTNEQIHEALRISAIFNTIRRAY